MDIMNYKGYIRLIETKRKAKTEIAEVLSIQKNIIYDEDLDIYEKGYLLASWNSYFKIENKAEIIAEIGSEFEDKQLANKEKADKLLKEAKHLIESPL